ncbi:uncharacterized protein FLJ40521-like isoform X6 [Prionailurus viverrinus]|uniref:uncharacterized protein FLJ40521-like isoform X6 n=1 Tax=Prionailurus viverrinus TaxID=61388 RepID=UPI001FF19E89|nr:uncharacterized protein FLJ40521-like isoform X6 [Prionailurus viverrinus]
MSSDGGRKLTEESEGPREGSRAAPRRRLSRGAEAEDRAAGRNGSGRAAPESGGRPGHAGHRGRRDTEGGGTPRAAGHRGRRDTEGGGTPRTAGHRGRRDTEDGGTPRTAGHRGRRDTEDGGTPRTAGHRGRSGCCEAQRPQDGNLAEPTVTVLSLCSSDQLLQTCNYWLREVINHKIP